MIAEPVTEFQVKTIVNEQLKLYLETHVGKLIDDLVPLIVEQRLKDTLMEILNVARREGGMLMAEQLMDKAMENIRSNKGGR